MPNEIEDRRQRALEAFWDTSQGTMMGVNDGLGEAIEIATQVEITPEMLRRMEACNTVAAMARAAFFTAGFEVIE